MIGFVQGSQEHSETFEIKLDDTIELGDYEFRFQGDGFNRTLTLGKIQEETTLIESQKNREEIEENIGSIIEADANLSYRIKEMGRNNDGENRIKIEANASNPIFADAELTSDTPTNIFVEQDDTLSTTITIENTGIVDQDFELTSTSEHNLESSFSFQEFNITQINVPAGETETVNTYIDIPGQTPPGTSEITIHAEDQTKASTTIPMEVRETIEEREPELEKEIDDTVMRANPNEEITINVEVGGQVGHFAPRPGQEEPMDLEDIELHVNSPEGWETTVQPEEISEVSEIDSETVTVTLNTPAEINEGDYFVELQATSNEDETDTEEIRINITEESNLRYIGLIIMILSVAALVIVYRKFGRR